MSRWKGLRRSSVDTMMLTNSVLSSMPANPMYTRSNGHYTSELSPSLSPSMLFHFLEWRSVIAGSCSNVRVIFQPFQQTTDDSRITALNRKSMAPIRRYLRITKYSVLEVRIYLSKPSDIAWLLSSRDPVLPRIIQEVRPKVLPKLREENENAKKKGSKKKKRGIKDVASQGM